MVRCFFYTSLVLSVRYNVNGKKVKQWRNQRGYKQRAIRLYPSDGSRRANSATTPSIAINVLVLVYGCAELQESSVTRLLPHYRVSCSEPLIEQLRMKEILKKDSNIIRKKYLSSRFYDKVLSGTKRDFSCTHGRMCGYELDLRSWQDNRIQ